MTNDDETNIYKYMSLEAYLYFLETNSLTFQRISNWPDSFEGYRYVVFNKIPILERDAAIRQYYGSCWSLQREDRRLFATDSEYIKSCEELEDLGSASMWQAYCSNGGVRLKTTIEKVVQVLNQNKDITQINNKIYYEPSLYAKEKPIKKEDFLFHKRTCFRYENEYRFLFRSISEENIINFHLNDMRDFVDEILVNPAVDSKAWISKIIYKLSVNSDFGITDHSTNSKFGKQLCRISQMYSIISEEL
jgi:hypothetical protein